MRRPRTPDYFFTIQLSEVIDLKELTVIVSHGLGSDRAKRKLVEKIEELQKRNSKGSSPSTLSGKTTP